MAKITLIVPRAGQVEHPSSTQPQPSLSALQTGAKIASTFRPSPTDPNDQLKFYNPLLYVPYLDGNDYKDSDYAWTNSPHLIEPL